MTTTSDCFPDVSSHLMHFLQPEALSKAAKKGEGSRGGHIIGHTKSGKPVYSPGGGGKRYHHMLKDSHYFKEPDEVHSRDANIVMGHYPGFTKRDHEEAGRILEGPNYHTAAAAHFMAAQRLSLHRTHRDTLQQAATNDFLGQEEHKRRNIDPASGKMGRTYSGHLIPEAEGPAYGSSVNFAKLTAGYSARDHKSAKRAHLIAARHVLRDALADRAAGFGKDSYDKQAGLAGKHLQLSEAHDRAAKSRRKDR